MAEVQYFYIDDDTAVLFAANGTALTALLVGLPDIVPLMKIPLPTYPMWIYFGGLIFAFCAKLIIQLVNGDTRQREKLQAARTFLLAALEDQHLTTEQHDQLTEQWALIERRHSMLLQPRYGPFIDQARALFFFLSAICFLTGTASLIYLAGFIETADAANDILSLAGRS